MKTTMIPMPLPMIAPGPCATRVAPTSPPTSACDELEGMPYHQVTRFQTMAPTRAPKMVWASIRVGSTMPLPTVAATFISNTITAAKLKVAAQTTAWCGFRTLVETMVAIEFAASWKPLRKSNVSARATRSTSVAMPIAAVSIGPGSGVSEADALDQLGDVLAPVGDRFEQLVDRLELDQLAHVGLLAKQPGHRRAHHPVGIRFDLVDLLAQAQDRV